MNTQNGQNNPNSPVVLPQDIIAQNMKRWMIALGIFLAVIILMTLLITITRSKSPVIGSSSTSTAGVLDNATSSIPGPVKSAVNFPTVMAAGDAIDVLDQPAGASVTVASVTVTTRTWVTVRDGARILGAALIGAGTHSDVEVSLLRNTTPGQTYQVVLHADNGDKIFNVQSDALVLESNGMTTGSAFVAR